MRIHGAAAATFCFLCWTLTRALAGGQTPLTPGDAALLVTPLTANDVELLPKAIADSDARVRMVAARVAGILIRRDLAAPLLELASHEQDAPAAAEQIRAVLFLRGETAVADDIEALRAVSQWRFQPLLVGGTAVPVIMTVTVNFALQ